MFPDEARTLSVTLTAQSPEPRGREPGASAALSSRGPFESVFWALGVGGSAPVLRRFSTHCCSILCAVVP